MKAKIYPWILVSLMTKWSILQNHPSDGMLIDDYIEYVVSASK